MKKEKSFCRRVNKKRMDKFDEVINEFKSVCVKMNLRPNFFDNFSYRTLEARERYKLKEATISENETVIKNTKEFVRTYPRDSGLDDGKLFILRDKCLLYIFNTF